MASDIIQNIKDIAHRISENYLLVGDSVNNALVESYLNGEMENEEVLKRVCEHVNQNVYLSLFNDASINKSNITFEIADFKTVLPIIRESEKAMSDLTSSPIDYRSKLSAVPAANNQTLSTAPTGEPVGEFENPIEKAASLYHATQYRDTVKNFISKIATLRHSEEQVADKAFDKMTHDTRVLVARGDSIGDISKIATRYVKDMGTDFVKVAQAYNIIHKDLVSNNYNVKTEFTKISSMKINDDAELLKPVREFTLAMAKIAGFNEMEANASKIISGFDKMITKRSR